MAEGFMAQGLELGGSLKFLLTQTILWLYDFIVRTVQQGEIIQSRVSLFCFQNLNAILQL